MFLWSPAVFGTANLVDGCITNAKVNVAAGIVSTKLVLTALAQSLIPAVAGAVDVGSAANPFGVTYTNEIAGDAINQMMMYSLLHRS